MGGLAFANVHTASGKTIQVPRMSPDVYQTVSIQCQKSLEKLFERVVIPRDAPGKADYGDIDFLVGGVRPHLSRCDLWKTTKDALGAELHLPRGESHSFAIKHPVLPDVYVQVDIELSPGDDTPNNAELFKWTRFMKGYSDLLQIVGVSHRPLGLTCNDQGLHLRVEEIEPYNKKKALLFLTRDPKKAMDFYGLDITKYRAGFIDEDDLFEWASSGRFFSHRIFESRVEKSNDRSRQAKRPMYRRFVEEYMPSHPCRGAANTWTREQVLLEALQTFDGHATYDVMMEQHHLKEAEEMLWKDIRSTLPLESSSLTTALKGLRRWVQFNNGKPSITDKPLDEPLIWTASISGIERDDVLIWVQDNWREVKALEKARVAASKEAAKTTL